MYSFSIPCKYTSSTASQKVLHLDPRLASFATSWMGDCGSVIIGPTGAGKSLSAAVAMRRVIGDDGCSWAAWVRADELSRVLSIREHISDVEKLKRALILVIDELGYERFPELVLEILGYRYDNELPTVITSGMKLQEMSDRYSDATLRRIVETGGGRVINCWKEPTNASVTSGVTKYPQRIIEARNPSARVAAVLASNLNAGRLLDD